MTQKSLRCKSPIWGSRFVEFLENLDLWLTHKPVTHRQASTKKRLLFIDQIKAVMIALVIAVHVTVVFRFGWFGIYIPIDVPHHPFFAGIAVWLLFFCNSFFMYMLFLVSGYFVPRSVHKKGIVKYLKERLLRIGLPLLFGLLLINSSSWILARLSPASQTADTPWRDLPFNNLGVLWFLVVLFAFDLIYCTWVKLRGDRFAINTSAPTPQLRSWLISAISLAIIEAMMAMHKELWAVVARLPLGGLEAQGSHVFTYAFLFFLGCKASSHRWLERLDPHLVVRWFRFSIAVALSLLAICLALAFNGSLVNHLGDLSLLVQLLNPFMGWGVMGYLLLWFQRNENRCGQWLANAGVDSYGAYIIHTLVLVIVLEAIGFIGLNPWLFTATGMLLGVSISFGTIHQLRRIPAVARVI